MAKSLIERLGEYRQNATTSLADQQEAKLIKSLQRLESDVVKEISRLPTRNGALYSTRLAIELRPKIKQYIEKTYLTTVQSNVADYNKIAGSVVATYGKLPVDEVFKEITEVDIGVINQLKKMTFAQFEDLGNEFVGTLSDEIYQSTLVGTPVNKVIENVKGKINGIYQSSDNTEAQELVDFVANNPERTAEVTTAVSRLQTIYGRDRLGNNFRRYATQVVQDSIMGFDGQFAKYRADQIGLDHFTYTGTTVRDSRDFCKTHVGKTYTKEQIENIWSSQVWKGKSQGDPFIVRGGYNCRHHWQPTDPSWNAINNEIPPVGEEIVQDTNIFGEVSEQESNLLPLAFGTVATNFTRMISKIPKTAKINKVDSAFYKPSNDSINLDDFDLENNLRARRVFAHEFAHKIDHNVATILIKNDDKAKKFIPNSNKLVVNIKPKTIKFQDGGSYTKSGVKKTLFDDVINKRMGEQSIQISNSAQTQIMADRINLKDNINVGLTNYTDRLMDLRNKLQGKTLNQRLAIRTKFLDDIIENKSFPLNKNELKILLKERNITYDPMLTTTVDYVLAIQNKLAVSKYGKLKKLKLKNGETFTASTREVGTNFDPMFADYVGAVSDNAIGFGHKLSYYNKFLDTETIKRGYGKVTYGHSTEAFANFTALSNTDNKEIYIKLMNYYAPQTTKIFNELYERSKLL